VSWLLRENKRVLEHILIKETQLTRATTKKEDSPRAVERRNHVEEYKENEVVDCRAEASVHNSSEGVEDLDREDLDDPLMVAELCCELSST